MTQPPANLLLRIEQLLNAGNMQDARLLLVDFIQSNPNSARAWWLLSMTLPDVDRQVAALKRVLRLDPENKLAQQRLDRLSSQLPAASSISPFTSSIMGESEEIADDPSLIPDWAKPAPATSADKLPKPPISEEPQPSPVAPAVINEPGLPTETPAAIVEEPEPSLAQAEPSSTGGAEPATPEPPSIDIIQPAGQVEAPTAGSMPGQPQTPSIVPTEVNEPVGDRSLPVEYINPEPPSNVPVETVELQAPSPLPPPPVEAQEDVEIPSPEVPLQIPDNQVASTEPEISAGAVPGPVPSEIESTIPAPINELNETSTEISAPIELEQAPSFPQEPIETAVLAAGTVLANQPVASEVQPPVQEEIEPIAHPSSEALGPAETSAPLVPVSEPVEPVATPPFFPEPQSVSPVQPQSVEPEIVSEKTSGGIGPQSTPAGPVAFVEPVEPAVMPAAVIVQPASTPIPTQPLEPKGTSAKRALFSELDKSFKTPPVSLESLASPALPPLSTGTTAAPISEVPSTRAVAAPPKPPAPVKPAGKASRPRNSNSRWEIVYILIAGIVILAAVSVIGYLSIQKKNQAQDQALAIAQSLQQTLVIGQTLTSLPLPTLIPTWTSSPTQTSIPSATFTSTTVPTSTLAFTPTKTPIPASLVGPSVGLFAPAFSLTDLTSGKEISLSQYEGQPVFIFFWATWCNYCGIEMGNIEAVFQANKDTGLVVLTVDAGDALATVTLYNTNHELTVPILLDPNSVFKTAYNIDINTIPLHFFIDSSGKIKAIVKGEMSMVDLQSRLASLLPPTPTATATP